MTGPMGVPSLLWHLGGLHTYEKVLVAVLAFGPFLVLFAVVYLARRRALSQEATAAAATAEAAAEKTAVEETAAEEPGPGQA